MTATTINGRWTLDLPDHRATLPSWPWWERDRLHAMWCTIRRGDVVYDIGAERGDLSALFASWGARMVLAEPSARAWPTIRTIFEANGLPTPEACWPGFIGAKSDGGALNYGEWPEWAHAEVVEEPGFCHIDERPDISTLTIDELVAARIPVPNVITMDVEGSELLALQGARQTLLAFRPTVFVSVHPEFMRDRYGHTSDDLLVLMTHLHGYEAHYLGFDHEQHWMFRP